LDERDWGGQYGLTFSLWLERAQCEFLIGNFDRAEQLIAELLQRGASKVDQAAVYHLKIQLHIMKSENHEAVASAITCLRLFGIDLPAHPTQEQVQTEYDTVWQTLDMRPIEGLIDLPLMTDPEMQAAMQVLSVVSPPRLFNRLRLCCFQACCMVKAGMQHGTSGASALALAISEASSAGLSSLQPMVIVCQTRVRPCRKHASSLIRRRLTTQWEPSPLGRSQSRALST